MGRLLLAAFLLLQAGCQLITCDEGICDGPDGGAAGGSAGGTAGGTATAGGGTAGGDAGGAPAGGSGGGGGGDAGGSAGGVAGGMAGGDAGGGTAGGAAGGAHTSIVFVTNATFHGNFQGQAPGYIGAAAADRLCQLAANNANPPLPGTFKAWVSGAAGISPRSRFVVDSSPWMLNGTATIPFPTFTALSSAPSAPLNRNENGIFITANIDVWTGATFATSGSTTNCATWSSNAMAPTTGIIGSTASVSNWMNTGTPKACNLTARLYCFEQQ